MKKVLITGGAGFIGHHLIEHLLKNTDWEIVTLDRLDTSGTLHRLSELDHWDKFKSRVTFILHDLRVPINDHVSYRIGSPKIIFHLAASTHVDRSISDPMLFVEDNVVGTTNLLNYARSLDSLDNFFYFSTDEVFGPAPVGVNYREWDRYKSGNPYAASKAGGEEMCLAFNNTYHLPVVITHCMNVFGERQNREKFLPLTIRKILLGETLQIHSDRTRTIPGSRFYIHARNVAAAMLYLHDKAISGEKYNIVGEREIDNFSFAKLIEKFIGIPLKSEMVSWHEDRPGHDLRYGLCGVKLEEMGWKIPLSLEQSLERTVTWYLGNPEWMELSREAVLDAAKNSFATVARSTAAAKG